MCTQGSKICDSKELLTFEKVFREKCSTKKYFVFQKNEQRCSPNSYNKIENFLLTFSNNEKRGSIIRF